MSDVYDRQRRGKWGEALAKRHLESLGYRILQQNYRCRLGEIDVIAQKGGTLSFIEVKLRTTGQFGAAEEAIPPRKRRRIFRAAQVFLQYHDGDYEECTLGALLLTKVEGHCEIRFTSNAFDGNDGWM